MTTASCLDLSLILFQWGKDKTPNQGFDPAQPYSPQSAQGAGFPGSYYPQYGGEFFPGQMQ